MVSEWYLPSNPFEISLKLPQIYGNNNVKKTKEKHPYIIEYSSELL